MSATSTSPSARGNHPALRSCWHPVAYADELGDGPVAVDLLDEPLVLWRDSRGAAHALRDLCIHRGTALSLGARRRRRDRVPLPRLAVRADGACTAIPQLADPTRVPAKARAPALRCQERYGLVWVALEEPRWALPEIPELDDDGWAVVTAGPYAWTATRRARSRTSPTSATSRGSTPGCSATRSGPSCRATTCATDGHVLHYEIVRPEAPNTDDFPVFGNEAAQAPERRSRYELHLPYTIVLRLGWGGEEGMVYFFASQPVDAELHRLPGDRPELRPRAARRGAAGLRGRDLRPGPAVVESQRPEQVPFDLADELHLKFDAVAVAYRRAMRNEGLAR